MMAAHRRMTSTEQMAYNRRKQLVRTAFHELTETLLTALSLGAMIAAFAVISMLILD